MLQKLFNFHKYIPNTISFFSIVSGIFAVKYAILGDFNNACLMIVAGVIFDFIDGFLARKLNATSDGGKLIDTICDFSTFGFSAFLICEIYWNFSILFSVSALAYLAAILYRLIRFTNNSDLQKDFFLGIPSPIASIFFLFPVVLFSEFHIPKNKFVEILNFCYNIFIALSTVSTIKMISNKNLSNLKKIFKVQKNKIYILISPVFFLFFFFLFTKPILSIAFLLILYYTISVYMHFALKQSDDKH